jgi:hypothetical protein
MWRAWAGYPVRIFIVAFIVSLLACCTLCRDGAVRDAERYAKRGYEARIATYDLKMDGSLYGAFLWNHHAQAQVYHSGKWLWVCELKGLCEEPTFRVNRMVVLWDVEDYKNALTLRRK